MELKPASVFEAFSEINRVPRPSKREDKMMEYLLEVGRSLGLETQRDEIGNVVIRKPATPGMEDRPILVLQSHMDMVCEKNNDVEFDFDNDAIQAYVDGDWVPMTVSVVPWRLPSCVPTTLSTVLWSVSSPVTRKPA